MGIVFKAEHRRLNRVVALKVMRSGELSNEEELARFRVEAESSAAIEHPYIVSIYEVGEARGLTYYTMAFVDGENLSALIRRQSLGFKESARVVARIADAVEAAHRIGIIHRDLKPSNILIDRAGDPYLIDFGLAKGAGTNQGLTSERADLGDSRLHGTGAGAVRSLNTGDRHLFAGGCALRVGGWPGTLFRTDARRHSASGTESGSPLASQGESSGSACVGGNHFSSDGQGSVSALFLGTGDAR
jgi:serine/threonine protein kinase